MNITAPLFEKTYTKDSIDSIASSLLDILESHVDPSCPAVLLFYGDLGYGKTTLIKHIGQLLGVGADITSPTFGIMRFYDTQNTVFKKFIHMDAYRLEEQKDVELLNITELLSTGEHTLIAIEWPTRIQSALPAHTFAVVLSNQNCNREDERYIQFVRNW